MSTEERLAELETRVAALETTAGAPGPDVVGDPGSVGDSGVIGDSGSVGESGVIGYEGAVRLHGEVSWRIGYAPAAVLDLPAGPTADVLAALGHPVRLALIRRLLRGPGSAAELQEAAGLSSTGQVYHHLRALTAARVVDQDGRSFRVPATGVVPVLTMLLAAGDVAGLVR